MKHLILSLALLASATLAQAQEKVTLSGVHNCCGGCTNGIKKAAGTVAGVVCSAAADKITLSGATAADLQKAVDAIVAAGYTGASDNAAVKPNPGTGPDEKVASLTITGTHMCCGKCVSDARKAVNSVEGVKTNTIATNAASFKVEGEFNAKALMEALAKAGFTGKATK